MWKSVGKTGLAVKAPWPTVEAEDKMLTRQGGFLRSALKNFRGQLGKAKKGLTKTTVLVTDSYPQWKVDALVWMQEQYDAASGSFPKSFMGDLKKWSTSNITDKKQIKFVMQFVSFVKREVDEVGVSSMDVKLPFDQRAILVESERYIKSGLNLEEINIVLLDSGDDVSGAPDKVKDQVIPGKPYLWMH